jgi:hypothetical protein
MPTKVCVKCRIRKDLSEFNRNKNYKDGLQRRCRQCSNDESRIYHATHKEERKQKDKENSEHRKSVNRDYYYKNRDKMIEQSRVNNERLREYRKQERLKPEKREKEKQRNKEWRENNRERYNQYFIDYHKDNPSAKIAHNYRTRYTKVLNGRTKHHHSQEILGCSRDFWMAHLESLFTERMTFDNYGFGEHKWTIGHKPPLAMYDLEDPEQQKEAFHWSHTFPQWTLENIAENSWYEGVRYYHKKDKKNGNTN